MPSIVLVVRSTMRTQPWTQRTTEPISSWCFAVDSDRQVTYADAVLRAVFPDDKARKQVDERLPPPTGSPRSRARAYGR